VFKKRMCIALEATICSLCISVVKGQQTCGGCDQNAHPTDIARWNIILTQKSKSCKV